MSLVTSQRMLQRAQKEGFAVPHFNISNFEVARAVLDACTELRSPVIIATSESVISYVGMKTLHALVSSMALQTKIPVALHLDHSPRYALARDCLKEGWTSLMRDASHLPFQQNVAETQRVVLLAHRKGVPVEAELGRLPGKEDLVQSKKSLYTDPDEAARFVQLTRCDSLAVSIGTSHGAYKFTGTPQLDFARLREIHDCVTVPLVLHGASSVPQYLLKKAQKYGADLTGARGVPDVQLKRSIREGICKINTDTDLRIAFDAGVREFLKQEPRDYNPRDMLAAAMGEMQSLARQKIKLFGSENTV